MNAQKFSFLLIALLFSCFALAQTKGYESKLHKKKSIPILTSNANGFAYVEVNPDGIGGKLKLAKLTRTFPMVKAKDVVELENYDTGQYMVYDLSTSPDNRYLVSYRLYSMSNEFTDILAWPRPWVDEMDILFYDMNTGEYLGFVNNSPLTRLNESLHPSPSLENYRQLQMDAGVPPEVVAEYDYTLHPEHSFLDFHYLHWNTDGTVSVTFRADVFVVIDNQIRQNIGTDRFTTNYSVNHSGVSLESDGEIKTAADWPPVFDLSVKEPLPGNMQFESQTIFFSQRVRLFPGFNLTLYRPKQAVMINGGIAARYWHF